MNDDTAFDLGLKVSLACSFRMTSRATNLTPKRGEQVQGLLKIYDRCFRQVISVKERKEWTFLNQIPVPTGSDHYKRRVKDLAVFSSEIVKFIISVRKNFNQCVSNDPKSVLEMRDLVFQLMVFLAAVKFNFFSEKQRDMMAHLRYNIVSPITSFFGDFYLLGQYVSFQQLDKTELCLCLSALAFETDETEKYLRGLLRDYSSDTYGHAQPNRWIKIHDQMDCTRDLLRTKGGIVFLAQTDLLQGLSGPSIDSLILKTFFQEPKQNAF